MIVYVPPPEDNTSDGAISLDERVIALKKLGPALGFDVEVVEAAKLLAGECASAFDGARLVWWCGRITREEEARKIVLAIESHRARLEPGARVLDAPEHVEEAGSLALSYPILEKAGVPQARTDFLPLTQEEWSLPDKALEDLLRVKLAGRVVPPRGTFFRSYYGTRKLHGVLCIAESWDDLCKNAAILISSLRERQPIGGLALREVLPIDQRFDEVGRVFVSREFRVFSAFGSPLFWVLGTNIEDLRKQAAPGFLEKMAALEPAQLARLKELDAIAAKALRVSLLVCDFALLDDGRIVLVETNEGHCSGWRHKAAYLAVHGQFLRLALGLPRLDPGEIMSIALENQIPLWGQEELFGLFDA